ncbi:MAG: type II toxin-antitoxin system RelE/ParE family toxin [Bacteroidetes bacterium]|nr:MAG: type II toxin-antitoxin system RelE/ParE family toxin [Bacteroidota bacterium]
MAKYILTNKAVDDLSQIWNYTYYKWSEIQADVYYNMLIDSCEYISENTNLGKNYEEIATYLFAYKVGRHIIFYQKQNEENILVIRILHQQMDLKNRLAE